MPAKQEVTGFIRSTFRSVWSLELLCLLRTNAGRRWSHEELVAALRASALVVNQGLAALTAAGLTVVEEDGSVQYRPVSPKLDELAAAAEARYAKSPDSVRRMIVASASGGLTDFADAFRLWKD